MAQHDIALMAHLLRRAGFGATREELEHYVARGYEATVEELLHPEDGPPALEDEDLIRRYHVDENSLMLIDSCQTYWLYRMVNTPVATGGKDRAVLAWCVCYGLYKAEPSQGHPQPDRHVPPLRAGQFPHAASTAVQRSGHALLAGQQR